MTRRRRLPVDIHYIPNARETLDAFLALSTSDWVALGGAVLWLVIVALPLGGIERRDTTTAVTYVVFCVAAAVALLLALPMRNRSLIEADAHVRVILVAALISGLRWNLRRKRRRGAA
jgi:hypothetical protein